ncbi:serine hydrolase [Propionibacterium sp. NM47_B9-13]|jgi:beta-lactamase class A|uniref:Beta-lactamase class A catalytic domain-containing protein n=1 Tax=Cutibacterium modestum HL044PA1 TaxID=765109 RepID=A0ABP2K850_9ACTN|nr:serine hydrolase [Cutibacterium modestum]TGY28622.1 serine hydrolase [Propionibacterium sp. NM47_B9-13]AOH45408.1 serine hydrolase [Cutibacterium modestum]EFS73435.1 hypothetical protein HMPREF9621_02481 [Cutibacterium modestum HL037PA2]EFS92225.1 hypothetical protein HMPREF9607_01566 [Cutibacterium modestum HL044PA1]EFT14297.1 hypothetical protein HMPREF9622_02675 [Cutibacterium modestum HL037PA3]
MRDFELPDLDPRLTWSVRITDADGSVLAEHTPEVVCLTASVGKLFLLVEVATQLCDGRLSPDQRIKIPADHWVADSGLLYRMRDQHVPVADAALLVGAVSDNLATNALVRLVGLSSVHEVAKRLGFSNTLMLDYIRADRGPDDPETTSYGCAAELCELAHRIGSDDPDEVLTDGVRQWVRAWLAADVDTSMLSDAFLLDPLAHVEPEYQGMVLRHKTGSIPTARIDVGHLQGPNGAASWAVAANWLEGGPDLRAVAIDDMRAIGEQIRRHVTGMARDDVALLTSEPGALRDR